MADVNALRRDRLTIKFYPPLRGLSNQQADTLQRD